MVNVQAEPVCSDSPPDQGNILQSKEEDSDIDIEVDDATICTTTEEVDGIKATHAGSGKIKLDISNTDISTTGKSANGILGQHTGTGDIEITVRDGASITTRNTEDGGGTVRGIYAEHEGSGKIRLDVSKTTIVAEGRNADGIYGRHITTGTGDVEIDVRDVHITVDGPFAHGVHATHAGSGKIKLDIRNTDIMTTGMVTEGILGYHTKTGTGDVEIDVRNGTVGTAGTRAHGISGWHQGSGDIKIDVRNAKVVTAGGDARGIFGDISIPRVDLAGDIDIDMRGGSVKTSGEYSYGIQGRQQGSGSIAIDMQGGSIETSGEYSYGIYGLQIGSGNIAIDMRGGSIETSGTNSHGIRAILPGPPASRRITVRTSGRVDARGAGASGVQIGRVENSDASLAAAFDTASRLRQQTVVVNGRVHGGSGKDAAGIYLAGGGHVVIGARGSVGADSGIAILATGGIGLKPRLRLRVDMDLAGRRLAEVIGDDWIVNDGGRTTIYINDVKLHDADTGVTGLSAPNGARNVRIRAKGVKVTRNDNGLLTITDSVNGIVADRDFSAMDMIEEHAPVTPSQPPPAPVDPTPTTPTDPTPTTPTDPTVMDMIEEHAPRAAVYEVLPGFLLDLDAAIEADRIARTDSPAWVRVAGGKGAYTPDRASVDAEFNFRRYSVEAGIDIELSENAKGSISVRSVQGSADVTAPNGGGKIEARGFGVASSVVADLSNAWYARGRFALTDYTLDTASDMLGRLKTDSGAQAASLELEIGKRIELGERMRLVPFGWGTHSTLDMDAFTDSVNARVSRVDHSRSMGGLGMAVETVRAAKNGNLSLRGSLGMEKTLSGTQTSVEVSGEELSTRSDRARPTLGVTGLYRWDRFSLEAVLSTAGLGTGDTQHAGSVKFGFKF